MNKIKCPLIQLPSKESNGTSPSESLRLPRDARQCKERIRSSKRDTIMKIATLCFLIRDRSVCLGMKRRGFGVNKYNGFGGKVGDKEKFKNESIEESIRREGKEEFKIDVKDLHKCAEMRFFFPNEPLWDCYVHVFISRNWGATDPVEGEEMSPHWFKFDEIPYEQMWDDDKYWLPLILEGKYIEGEFTFDKDGLVIDKKIFVFSTV